MKKLNQKLTLKKETLAALDKQQMNSVKGGFTSIGHWCSHHNDCSRQHHISAHCASGAHGGCLA